MLVQLHHQFKDGTTICRAQRDVTGSEELAAFVKETIESDPLPEGAGWIACLEGSPFFVGVKKESPITGIHFPPKEQ
jgi:hypothetical protein